LLPLSLQALLSKSGLELTCSHIPLIEAKFLLTAFYPLNADACDQSGLHTAILPPNCRQLYWNISSGTDSFIPLKCSCLCPIRPAYSHIPLPNCRQLYCNISSCTDSFIPLNGAGACVQSGLHTAI
jgi:hypothetical protein